MHRITRGRVLLGVVAIAFTGADAAGAQVTEAPPVVPPAQGELDESAGIGEGDPTSPLVAAGGGALVLVGAGVAALWSRRRRSRTHPGGTRDVVASVAGPWTGPVYEVVWRHDGRRACFELAGLDGDDDDAFELPRSRASTWRVEGRPPAVTSLRLDLAELSTLLRNSGWQPAGSGDAWYALRFRAPTRSSHPEQVGARRRS